MRVIRTPNEKYTGERNGAVFYKGRAEVEDEQAEEFVKFFKYFDVTDQELGKPIKKSFRPAVED